MGIRSYKSLLAGSKGGMKSSVSKPINVYLSQHNTESRRNFLGKAEPYYPNSFTEYALIYAPTASHTDYRR